MVFIHTLHLLCLYSVVNGQAQLIEQLQFVMKLRIRLQNHGVANHPYWWIVIAAHRKNIRGRFIQHVGYWTPREGANVDRQITLNIPRIKYWMGCGAVPTPKIQRFLSYWDIMPKPWYPERTPEELAALRKPESEWTDHDKRKQERKQKRRERLKLSYINYLKPLAKYKSYQTVHYDRHMLKIRQKINAAERQNQILREILLHNEFGKISRINELSGKAVTDDTSELLRLQEELKKAKAQLALLDKHTKNFSPLQKTKIIKDINALVDKIRIAEIQRSPFRFRNPAVKGISQNTTQFQLDRKIQYELITKKLENVNKQLENLQKLYETVTIEQFANYIFKYQKTIQDEAQAFQKAEQIFIHRGRAGLPPLTKYELYYSSQILNDPDELLDFESQDNNDIDWNSNKRKTKKGKSQKAEVKQQSAQEGQSKQAEEGQPKQGEKQAKQGEGLQKKEGEEAGEGQNEGDKKVARDKKNARNFDESDPYQGFASIKQFKLDLSKAQEELKKVTQKNMLKYLLTRPDVIVPTNRPVHPFPDLQTYIPEEYYEPISNLNLKVTTFQSLQSNDLLKKYHQKRTYSDKSANGKTANSKAKRKGKSEKRTDQTV